MSRNKDYQRLLNSRRWRELRLWKLEHNPLCEICEANGVVAAAVDVHHITPVESATSVQQMVELAFNPLNLRSLCIPCHIKVHQELGNGKREDHKRRQKDSLERWKDKQNKEINF